MPQPPITIGELTDVPTFDSPIASPWAQEVSRRVVHRFATTTERDSKYPANTAGSGAVCEVAGVPYTSDGAVWNGPIGFFQQLLVIVPGGSGAWRNVLWGASNQAGGQIVVDANGVIYLGAGATTGVWNITYSINTNAAVPAGQVVPTRILLNHNGGASYAICGPNLPPGSVDFGASASIRTGAPGATFQVQTYHTTDRNYTGGFISMERVGP